MRSTPAWPTCSSRSRSSRARSAISTRRATRCAATSNAFPTTTRACRALRRSRSTWASSTRRGGRSSRALLLEPASTELLICSRASITPVGDFAAAETGFKAALASAALAERALQRVGRAASVLSGPGANHGGPRRSGAPIRGSGEVLAADPAHRPQTQHHRRLLRHGPAGRGPSDPRRVRRSVRKRRGDHRRDDRRAAARARESRHPDGGGEARGRRVDDRGEPDRDVQKPRRRRAARGSRVQGRLGASVRAAPGPSAREPHGSVRAHGNRGVSPRARASRARPSRRYGWTLERIPGGAAAYVELARVLEARGDAAGARAALERALAIWSLAEPDFEPAAEAEALLAAAVTPP